MLVDGFFELGTQAPATTFGVKQFTNGGPQPAATLRVSGGG